MSDQLPLPTPEEFEAIINPKWEAFEAAWQTYLAQLPGSPPQVEDFCSADNDSPAHRYLYRGLRGLDQEYRDQLAATSRNGKKTLPAQPVLNPEPGRSTPEPSAAATWPRIPGYEILEELGHGGFGVVYKALEVRLKRLVALKMILPKHFADEEARPRFQREAEAVAQLRHPNIVQIFDSGEHQGQPFFSLEFVEGGSLAKRLNGTPWAVDQAARLIEVLALAVQAAHEKLLVHRDLTPGNVLMTADTPPIPKVTDFGLVKWLDPAGQQSQSEVIAGTPSYMSPEQACGNSQAIGPTTDVYALGAILYELLTGRPPFKGPTSTDTMRQVFSDDEPVSPRRLQPKVPADLEAICLKCLEKNQKNRYSSAAKLAEDLRRFLDGKPTWARPVGKGEWVVKWVKRHPAWAALIAVSFLAASALGWLSERITAARTADGLRRTAENERGKAEAERVKADSLAYVLSIKAAEDAVREGEVTRAAEILDACKPELRHWEWHYLRHQCPSASLILHKHTNSVESVSFSPDSRWLASGSHDRTVKVWDTSTGDPVHTIRVPQARVTCVTFSPDGRNLAIVTSAGVVEVWDQAVRQPRLTLRVDTGGVSNVSFSPDGRTLAGGSFDRTVKVWDLETGEVVLTIPGHKGVVSTVSFSPDGRLLIGGSTDNTVKVWDAATGLQLQTLAGHTGRVRSVTFSPDGRWLASGADDQTVKVWDITTGKQLVTLFGHTDPVSSVSFSPNGQRLASGADDGSFKVWDVASGEVVQTIRGHTEKVTSIAFSPDGQKLASGSVDKTVKLWDVATGPPVQTLKGHTDSVNSVRFSPDGGRLASGSSDRTVKVWDIANCQEPITMNGHKGRVRSVSFSPDGRKLASGSADQTLKLWDTATGRELLTLLGHTDSVSRVCFSPDGGRLASCSADRTIKVWDGTTGQFGYSIPALLEEEILDIGFSPDGEHLASVGIASKVDVWDAASGKSCVLLRGGPGPLCCVAYSPDGRCLASGSENRTVLVWDVVTGDQLVTLRGHTREVRSVSFSPDGRRLASGSSDGTVKVWDTVTGQQLLTLRGHTGSVSSVAFSPDGRRLASGSSDKTVKVWDSQTGR